MSLILYPVVIAVVTIVAVVATMTCLLDKGVTRHEGGKRS
jgi:hypothetical protein